MAAPLASEGCHLRAVQSLPVEVEVITGFDGGPPARERERVAKRCGGEEGEIECSNLCLWIRRR